ncbi:MAG: DUF3090 family protein [Caldilineales bacterium]|nr:DUF3090 family protein [Caldilineales bacterium]
MPDFAFDFDPADHLTVGTIGEPGHRTFFLQAGRGIEFVTMICEKEQMRALGEGLLSLLDQIAEVFHRPTEDPDEPIDFELVHPLVPAWRIAQLGVGYDDEEDVIVIVAQELVERGQRPELARFIISREHARALAYHVLRVVAAGRPTCPLCGEPMDPGGHFCPPSNGHGKLYVQ